MTSLDYLLLQMELEGLRRLPGGLIARTAPGMDDFPLVLLAHLSDGKTLRFFDNLLSARVSARLSGRGLESLEAASAVQIFARAGLPVKVNRFRTYTFPPALSLEGRARRFSREDPRVVAFGFSGLGPQVFGVEQDDRLVSACVSSRQNAACGEAWVFTDPRYRRQGLAAQVVTTWARDLEAAGLIPFYSHALENGPSAGLAASLNLIHLFDETVVEHAC